jgi:hypothetical protein
MSAMPRSRLGTALAPALTGLVLALAPPSAAGDVAFRASVTPTAVSSPARLTYSLTMVNDGGTEERFSVALVSPTYHATPARTGASESGSVHRTGMPEIEGPARVLGGYVYVAGLLPSCSVAGVGDHGYGLDGMSFDVGLPARSTSVLRIAYEAGLPFWPDLDLRLRFLLGPQLTTGEAGTLATRRKVVTPQPAIIGNVAVHLTFSTSPATGVGGYDAHPPLELGKRLAIVGDTKPVIAGQRVELRYARVGTRANVLERGRVARPKVDARGRFRARWTPKRPGSYELWARYVSRQRGLLSDDTCPRLVRVTRP